MKILLRLVAAWVAWASLVFAAMLARIAAITSWRLEGTLLFVFMVVGVLLGLFAAVELFRLHPRGRAAALGFCIFLAVYAFLDYSPRRAARTLKFLATPAAAMVVLLLPGAGRVLEPPEEERPPVRPPVRSRPPRLAGTTPTVKRSNLSS